MDIKKILISLVVVQSVLLMLLLSMKTPVKPVFHQPPPSIEEPEVPPETPPEKPPELLKNFATYSEALEASKKYNRPMFLYFKANWCGWCHKMSDETLSQPEVKERLGKEFVVCIIDTDVDKTTARKYQVTGIPSYMVVSSNEVALIRDSGFKSKSDFLQWLKPKNVSLIIL